MVNIKLDRFERLMKREPGERDFEPFLLHRNDYFVLSLASNGDIWLTYLDCFGDGDVKTPLRELITEFTEGLIGRTKAQKEQELKYLLNLETAFSECLEDIRHAVQEQREHVNAG
jgi:hypothetical protein